MTDLLVLPTELLVRILAASDSIPDAMHFSAANRRLRDIWMEHTTSIIEAVLRASIPAYEEALDLAVTETQLQCSMQEKPSIRQYLPALLRNADLCASACLGFSAHRRDDPSPPKSYYFLRRVSLGYEYHQMRDELYADLRAMSRDALLGPSRLGGWLLLDASFAEKVRQGIEDKDYDDVHDYDKERETKWDYAHYCILSGAIGDIDRGANNLPIIIQGCDI